MSTKRQRTSTSRSAGGTLVGMLVLSVAAASATAAQPASSGRLNKIIEQFEMGEPAVAGEHWQINSLEHNPFLVDELEAFLDELEAEDAPRPRLTPIVRIPHEADQPFQHVVKQMLDAGAMGIVLPQVRT
ncbi:MAG: hypothetical protein OXH69_20855, partial [Acidobacteria bacterium]|nr:hypothetical protein [Acidobacteriota bacterium]